MARRRFAPLQTEKREITWSNLAADASTGINVGTLTCVRDPTTDVQCTPGTRVNWIYGEFNVSAQTVTNPKVFHWQMHKNPTAALTFTATAYNQDTKSWIMKRGMEMLPADRSTVYKRIFTVKPPQKMRRMSEGDIMTLRSQSSSAETQNFCGFLIYNITPA